jgi:acetyl-CoA carboxylase carboxyl transferase subunit beta
VVKGITEVLSALFSRQRRASFAGPLAQEHCLVCNAALKENELYQRYSVCPQCRFHYSITARQRIQLLVDPGSFKEQYRTISSLDPLSFQGKVPYRKRLFRDQRRTGLTEAAVVGRCRIGGEKAVLFLLDFSFMGGSMGCVVGEKVALAFELAAAKRLPVLAVISSGGVRLQEGVLSLMQMAKTTTALSRLNEKGLPYIAVLANPTTGQAYASFANLADVILAEPGALMGFAPLGVLQEASEKPLPLDAHTAEAHLAHGMVDGAVDREQLRFTLTDLLGRLSPQRSQVRFLQPRGRKAKAPPRLEAWEAVQRVRRHDRPAAADYVQRLITGFVELRGDRVGRDDPAMLCGVGSLDGCSVVVIGQQRQTGADGEVRSAPVSPEGLRKAQRAMHLAAKFGMPLITLIDTEGPALTLDAEKRGIGNVLAATMTIIGGLPVPTVAVIIGEGGREGALALIIADRILMQESAIFSPISPEAAAGLMYRDPARAKEAASSLRLTAADALAMQIVDTVVPEPQGGAHEDPDEAARLLHRALLRALAQVQAVPAGRLLRRRYKKFRNMGEYTSYFRVALAREVEALQSAVGEQVKEVRGRRRRRKQEEGKLLTLPVPLSAAVSDVSQETQKASEPLKFPVNEENQGSSRTD